MQSLSTFRGWGFAGLSKRDHAEIITAKRVTTTHEYESRRRDVNHDDLYGRWAGHYPWLHTLALLASGFAFDDRSELLGSRLVFDWYRRRS